MSQTRAVIQLLLSRGLGSKTLGRLLDAVVQEQITVEDLVQLTASELVSRYGLKPEVAHGITSEAEAAQTLRDAVEAKNIRLLVKHQEGYPARLVELLGESAPPILFAAGNLSILGKDAVSFCGSRKSSDFGLTVTSNIAADLARKEINVVSGYAAGVDLTAHAAALEFGGATTLVLAEGILPFRPKQAIASLITNDNLLVLSEFHPAARWAAHNAMQRNRTICALSKAVILIESGMDGGTFNAGKVAQSLGIPLFVIDFEESLESAEGNKHFLSLGASGLRPDATGKVDVGPVTEAINGIKLPVAATKSNGLLFPEMEPTRLLRKTKRNIPM